jgi:hypothetical protein
VQGIGIPIAQSVSMADWPRGLPRGLFRGNRSPALTNQLQRRTFPRAPSLRGLETAMESLAPRFGVGPFSLEKPAIL